MWGLFLATLVCCDTVIKSREEAPTAQDAVGSVRERADLMATDGQFYWPSVGTYVAASGQFFMAANRAVRWLKPLCG